MGERKYYHFTNKLMFAIVMRDESLCAELLERIFGRRKIREIKFQADEAMDGLRERVYHDEIRKEYYSTEVEKTIITGPHSKSVRLDVLFQDDEAWYDIEMQIEREKFLPQRSRYYHSVMTVDSMNIGEDYVNLKKSFVIFICMFDYFKTGNSVYTIHMRTDENGLPFDDGQTTILVNMKCSEDAIPSRLRSFYDYVNEARVAEEDGFIRKLQERTNRANQNQEVYRYMTFEEEYNMRIKRLEDIVQDLEHEKIESDAFNRLIPMLLEQNRTKDLQKASEDVAYRRMLLEEFQLI